jgi:hypothetical protein
VKVALFALIGLFVPLLAFARFDASADPTTISEAGTIRLTLRADSTSISSNPISIRCEGIRHSERSSAARRSRASTAR